MSTADLPYTVFITSPLDPEHVERMRSVAPDQVEVIYEPDLLPPVRYVADHDGVAGFELTAEQRERWRANLQRSDILWDFPKPRQDDPGVLELAPNLKWVQTTSAGVGQAVRRLGLHDSELIVTTASGVHAAPLAEFVFLALLQYVKDLPRLQRDQRAHHWERYCCDELAGRTLAIVGAGKIGRHVASVAHAFGMRVTAMTRKGGEERRRELGVDAIHPRSDLHAMLGKADAVVLSLPHTPETESLIDGAAFEAMKDGAVFINIARGQVVDESDLQRALESGKIAFAALDVFRTEPLPPESPFWDMPNVLVSPHSASTAGSENGKITEIFCHNLRCYLDGRIEDMHNVLDKTRMY